MWKKLRESHDNVLDRAGGGVFEKPANGNTARNNQVMYVANPLSAAAHNDHLSSGQASNFKSSSSRNNRPNDEDLGDDLMTDGDRNWLWLAAEHHADRHRKQRLRWRLVVATTTGVLLVTALLVLIVCIQKEKQQNSVEISATAQFNGSNVVESLRASEAKSSERVYDKNNSHIAELQTRFYSVTVQPASRLASADRIKVSMSTASLFTSSKTVTETILTNSTAAQCLSGQFYCSQGVVRSVLSTGPGCISSQQLCDGIIDCVMATDERNCSCRAYQFRCRDGIDRWSHDGCIQRAAVCDRVADCLDSSDEQDCTFRCPSFLFMCASGRVKTPRRAADRSLPSYCLRWGQQCDGSADCEDGSDEFNCNQTCPTGMARCANGTTQVETLYPTPCLKRQYWCDRLPHCSDGSDEVDCQYSRCPWGMFACTTGSPVSSGTSATNSRPYSGCLFNKSRCDGIVNCRDGSDEAGCRQK